MGFQKFGDKNDGKVLPPEDQEQPDLAKTATRQDWTGEDQRELEEENER